MATDSVRAGQLRGDTIEHPDAGTHVVTDGRAPVWVPVFAVVLGVLASGYVAQVVTPFIRRDDWPYMLPAHAPGGSDVWRKNLTEGRWLNYAWWLVVGQHETPLVASVLYALAYGFFVVGFVRLFTVRGRLATGLLTLAVFASPLWERLVYWPATLTPSVIVAALAVWSLPRASTTRVRLGVWMGLATVLCVLTYPPMAPVVLVAALVLLRDRSWRTTLGVCVVFVVGYGLGILAIYLLNWIAFRHFGIRIAAWRHPNTAHSLHDLVVNARRYAGDMRSLAKALGWVTLVAVGVLGVAALLDRRTRGPWLRVLTGLAVVFALGGAQTVLTGVTTNPRGLLWGWLLAVVPAGLLLASDAWARWVGVGALVALSVIGLVQWRSDVAAHQQTRREYAAIVDAAVAAQQRTGVRDVVLYQDPVQRKTAVGGITAGTIQMMLYEYGGIVTHWCSTAQCSELKAQSAAGPVVPINGAIGVIVPKPASWL
ncbi:hypothetical protein [Intrasporangium sp. YIM S08009]|uniref:hypothetical protein n=1 Tax=Intrasporangium zincisolvens TaxID=3080018 RepID=UPI002B058F7B|nr:hypothetical protein [Intrasporangium sp. YIM S08009]